jgi:hypothetical protein
MKAQSNNGLMLPLLHVESGLKIYQLEPNMDSKLLRHESVSLRKKFLYFIQESLYHRKHGF